MNKKTPVMGWASWNAFRTHISEDLMKSQADALITTGLAQCGYTYLNMDDGFFGGRDDSGTLSFHKERFPNGIKPVADYAHSLGLQAGIYSDGGNNTCGFYYDNEGANGCSVGLYSHEEQDLKLLLEDYGFDFIKVDWCGGIRLGLSEQEQYTKIGKIIDEIRHRTGRRIVYNVCRWQFPGAWVTQVADSWRTGADIRPNFSSVMNQLDYIKPLAAFCSPGHVNDPDMLELGNGMSPVEEKTHFSMWCMMSAPLIIGCDLRTIPAATLAILKNQELIAIDQDPACLQALPLQEIQQDGEIIGEIWIKDLGKRDSAQKAIAFVNRGEKELTLTLSLRNAGLTGKIVRIRNLWTHREEDCAHVLTVTLQPHECAIYKVESTQADALHLPPPAFLPQNHPLRQVSHKDIPALLEQGAILVDVRLAEEYNKEHLEGALHLPYTGIHSKARILLPDRSQAIILYCNCGKYSYQAKIAMENLGYENIYYLGSMHPEKSSITADVD